MRKEVKLKYCVRMRHSEDMPLQKPRLNCAFRGSSKWNRENLTCVPDDCIFHPAHIKYCAENDINLRKNFDINFKCVLDDA